MEQISHHPPISAFEMIGPGGIGVDHECWPTLPQFTAPSYRGLGRCVNNRAFAAAGGAYTFTGHSQPDVSFKANTVKTTAKVGPRERYGLFMVSPQPAAAKLWQRYCVLTWSPVAGLPLLEVRR
jgi:hypothetical protein